MEYYEKRISSHNTANEIRQRYGMNDPVPDRVLGEILLFAKKHHMEKVILFGSRARGSHSERSDIDIAAFGGDFDSFYWDIKENVHSLLMFDVVDLNKKISDELRDEIRKEGITIYEKNG